MAARYWVGGTDTWDATAGTKWASTSGGAGGQSVPTAADTVFFDAASGANTVTIDTGAVCLTLTMTGFTGTLAFGSNKISIAGNNATIFTGATTYSVTGTPLIECTYSGATGTRTFNPGATTEANSISLKVIAGTDILRSTGTQAFKNYDFTGFSGTLNNSARTIYGDAIFSSTMVHESSTAVMTFAATSGTQKITSSGVTLNFPVTINAPGATVQLQDNLNTGLNKSTLLTAGTFDLAGKTLTTDSINSTAANVRTLAFGATGKIVNTRTASGTYAVDLFNASVNLTLTGTPVWEFTGNFAVSSGIRGSATTVSIGDVYIKSGTGTFTLASGFRCGTVDFTGFSGTLAAGAIDTVGDIVFSTGMTISASTSAMSFLKSSGIQKLTTNGKTFDRPITIGSASTSPTLQLQDNCTVGNTRTFTITAGSLDLTGNTGNWTLSIGLFSSSNSNIRSIIFGTGAITVTGNNATVWNAATVTNFSFTGTQSISFNYSGATGTRTILHGSTAGGSASNAINVNITAGSDATQVAGTVNNLNFTGYTGAYNATTTTVYGNLTYVSGMSMVGTSSAMTFAATTGTQSITTGGLTIDQALTFNGIGGTFAFQDALTQGSTRAFTLTNGTVQLKNGVTSTVGAFATSGTNQKFLQSTSAGNQATISQASGTVNASYLTIQDSNATGGATWLAYVDQQNVDNGNNDGWDFGISPVVGGAEYTYRLRSFTEMRQF